MPALVKKFNLFNLSVTYDGITFYPKCDLGGQPRILNFISECNDVIRILVPGNMTENGIHFGQACDTVANNVGPFQNVYRDNDDHDLYHQDSLNQDDTHIHIRFPSMLTSEQLSSVLNIFVKNMLFTEAEKHEFIYNYDVRFVSAHFDLSVKLVNDQMIDMQTIINHIKGCKDNEILADLHRYLLTNRHDYLRSASQETNWQGTDAKGHVVKTSEAWAMIEKKIAFQMAHNVKDNVSKFTPHLAEERALQLSQHAFFGLKRKQNAAGPSKMFAAFSSGDGQEFEARYQKQSTGMRR